MTVGEAVAGREAPGSTDGALDGATAAPRPGPRSAGHGAVAVAGLGLALLTTALGVVGIRDALVHLGALGGRPWIDAATTGLDGLRPQWWGVPLGVAAVALGALVLWAAVWPGPRTAFPVASHTGVVLRRRAVGRLAERAALEVAGVLSARARVGRRGGRVEVSAWVTGAPDPVADQVQGAVEERLAVLQPPPRVRVRARTEPAP